MAADAGRRADAGMRADAGVLAGAGIPVGRTAVVTGGSRGIGRAIATALVQAGVDTIIVARNASVLDATARAIGATSVAGDLCDVAAAARVAAESANRFGGAPSILVNAAGTFAIATVAETTPAMFNAALSANVCAPFNLIHAFLPGMLERGSGHIVTIGSIAGRVTFAGNAAYASSKFAVRGLHGVLDAELRGTGVRTTLIEPAATDTDIWDSIDRDANPGLPERESMMRPEAVADAVMYALTRSPDVAIRNIILERS